jgi:hypothetical protein
VQTNRSRRLRAALAVPVTTVVAALGLSGCNADAGTGLWARSIDPVVLTGDQLPDLVGTVPGDVVAFRYDTGADAWEQVPVQVDERHVDFLAKLRNGTGSSGPTTIAYSDPGANAGPDPVATFDANDEVAFMADDTGGQAASGAGYPDGVTAGSGVQVTVTDPLAATQSGRGSGVGYVYLFQRSGSLPPDAGADYVDYEFAPADPTGHAEDSTVSTDRYSTHFAARWVRDGLTLGTGPDILDRHRNLFAPGVCLRSEDTFSAGAGGYASNIDGPVRAIRSYLGANSGTYTQREHTFYRQTERVQTFLRVHAISGIMDFYDYSAAAIGMTYSSSSTPGVTIDGVPDASGSEAPTWESVSGSPGTLVSVSSVQTDISGVAMQAYYSDDSTPSTTQCTGDAFEYGASGTHITSALPNTDPAMGAANTFTATRWNAYVPAGEKAGVARLSANATTPVTAEAAPY